MDSINNIMTIIMIIKQLFQNIKINLKLKKKSWKILPQINQIGILSLKLRRNLTCLLKNEANAPKNY